MSSARRRAKLKTVGEARELRNDRTLSFRNPGAMDSGLIERLDRVEADLGALRAEVEEIRRAASTTVHSVVEGPPDSAAPETAAESLRRAWLALERGRERDALELASAALDRARASGDASVAAQIAVFAEAATPSVRGSSLQEQVGELAERARGAAPPSMPVSAPSPPPTTAREVAVRPSPAARLVRFTELELSGGRAFAVAGGVVTLLGIVFLFVLAANRGWIGPVARVSIGAIISATVLAAGVVLRIRYGRLQASLAAVGTGIAGAYATLAAATIIYGFLPDWGALLVAAVIAATGCALGLRWQSEILAGLSLVGGAAAPGLVALDEGIGAGGTAFAVIVLAAAFAAAAPRRWLWLAVSVCAIAVAQVVWLTGASPAEDVGATAVVAGAALVLLAGAIAWQATWTSAALEPFAATIALGSGGLSLGGLLALLPVNREAGLALAGSALVYGGVGATTWRRWRDLASVIFAVALLLGAVSTALVFSGRSLTVVLAVEAAALAGLAWRLAMPRFELASLVYLSFGILHMLAIDITTSRPPGDLPASAAAGLFALAAAALVAGTLALGARRDEPSVGMLATLEPVWNQLVAGRAAIRMWLYGLTVALAAAGTAAVLSGTWLTLTWLAAALSLGIGAFGLGERRMQAAALLLLGLAAIHALLVEAPTSTLVLTRGLDPLAPVASLAALAVVSAALGQLALFSERAIPFLGPLEGPERSLAWLGLQARVLRSVLFVGSAWLAVWAAGLVLIQGSYEPGQVVATGLWALTGAAGAALAARRRSIPLAVASLAPTLLAFGKAALFDWDKLGDGWAAAALIVGAASVLLFGFFVRYAAAGVPSPLEFVSLACAIAADVSALVAVDRVIPDHTRMLGAAALAVALAVGLLALPPFRDWKRARPERWLRNLATVYWSLALVTIGFGERDLALGNRATTVALWAVTAAAVAGAARPLQEMRLWLAGAAASFLATGICLTLVTVPSRLVSSSAHPGSGLWALAVCIGALTWIATTAPPTVATVRTAAMLTTLLTAVFGLSLGVLEIAERISGASIATDFQRGHTAVSALWGALALGLFVAGIIRADRFVQRIGLGLFGLALAKLFLYDLRTLSSITRALSFLAVGAILLAAAFFTERIIHGDDHAGPRTA